MTSTPTPTATELPAKCGCGGEIQLPDGCMKYYASDEFEHAVDPLHMLWAGGMGPGQAVFENPDQAEMAAHLEANGLSQDEVRLILLSGPTDRVLEIEVNAWRMVVACLQDVRMNYEDPKLSSHMEDVHPGETSALVDMIITPSLGHATVHTARLEMSRDAGEPWQAHVTITDSKEPDTQTMFDVSFMDGNYVAKFGAIIGRST